MPNAKREAPEKAPETSQATTVDTSDNSFISEDMLPQLNAVFERMQNKLTLEVHSDGGAKSLELLSAMKELSALTVDILPLLKQGDSYRPI